MSYISFTLCVYRIYVLNTIVTYKPKKPTAQTAHLSLRTSAPKEHKSIHN